MAMTRSLLTKIKPLFSFIRPFSAVPDTRAELAAVKAWDAKLWLATISARAKFVEAQIHSAAEKAAMEVGEAPDSAAVAESKAKAKTCLAEKDTHLAVVSALIAEGEAREPEVKARFGDLKAKMKDSSVSCVEFEELTALVEVEKFDFVKNGVKIYQHMAKLESQLMRVEGYNPQMEAQIAECEAQYAESLAQFGEINAQRKRLEAKIAEMYEKGT